MSLAPRGRTSSTHGQLDLIVQTEAITAARTEHPANLSLPPHSHPTATVTIVLGGGYHENDSDADRELPSMAVVIKPAGTTHANTIDHRGARCVLLEVSEETVHGSPELHTLFSRQRVIDITRAADVVIRIACGSSSALEVESLSMDLLSLFVEEACGPWRVTHPTWLGKIRDRLHARTSEGSLTDLALDAGCHPIYLARAFRHRYSESIGTYTHRLRLARSAKDVAQHPRRSLSAIAHSHGYYDHSHFSNDFRARTGVTPSEWRARAVIPPKEA